MWRAARAPTWRPPPNTRLEWRSFQIIQIWIFYLRIYGVETSYPQCALSKFLTHTIWEQDISCFTSLNLGLIHYASIVTGTDFDTMWIIEKKIRNLCNSFLIYMYLYVLVESKKLGIQSLTLFFTGCHKFIMRAPIWCDIQERFRSCKLLVVVSYYKLWLPFISLISRKGSYFLFLFRAKKEKTQKQALQPVWESKQASETPVIEVCG